MCASSFMENLPLDILLGISFYLNVSSVLHLSFTCKSLFSLVNQERAIWINLLLNEVFDRGITPGSFSLLQMDLRQLKTAVSRPKRLRLSLPSSITQVSQSYNLLYSTYPGETWRPVGSTATVTTMLPGGRWALGVAKKADSWFLFCWDLKNPTFGGDTAKLEPVCHIMLDEDRHKIPRTPKLQFQAESSTSLLILINHLTSSHWHWRPGSMRVIRLTWLSESMPIFSNVASINQWGQGKEWFWDTVTVLKAQIDGEHVVMAAVGGDIIVWNWKQGTLGRMDIREYEDPGTPQELRYHETWLHSPYIFVFGTTLSHHLAIKIPARLPSASDCTSFPIPSDIVASPAMKDITTLLTLRMRGRRVSNTAILSISGAREMFRVRAEEAAGSMLPSVHFTPITFPPPYNLAISGGSPDGFEIEDSVLFNAVWMQEHFLSVVNHSSLPPAAYIIRAPLEVSTHSEVNVHWSIRLDHPPYFNRDAKMHLGALCPLSGKILVGPGQDTRDAGSNLFLLYSLDDKD